MSIYGELGIVFAFSIALSALYTWTEIPETYSADAEQNGYRYLSFSATFLALLLSFTIYTIWQSYTSFKSLIYSQVAEIGDFYNSIKGQPDSRPILIQLENYLTSVINDQWPASRAGYVNEKTAKLNRELLSSITAYNIKHPHLTSLLNLRLKLSHQLDELIPDEIDNYLVLIIMIISIIFLIMLWFIRFEDDRIQYIFNLGTIFIISLALYFLVVLSQPYNNHAFEIKPNEFIKLRDQIRTYLNQTKTET